MVSIPIGPPFSMVQNTVYAMPVVSVEIIALSGAVLQTSLEATTNFSNISTTIVTGAYAQVVTGNASITLRKNGVG